MTSLSAGELTRLHFPKAQKIEPISHGYDNDVFIVDSSIVFRIPRNSAMQRKLLFEAELLIRLNNKISLDIPALQFIDKGGTYGAFSYLSGFDLSLNQVRSFSERERKEFAKKIVGFMREIGQALSTREFKDIQKLYLNPNSDEDKLQFQKALLKGRADENVFVDIFEEWLGRYDNNMGRFQSLPKFVVHNDMHVGNMRFDKNNSIIGIFDFGDACMDNIMKDLSYLYRYGKPLIKDIIEQMGGDFGDISTSDVHLYSVTHELSVLMRHTQPDKHSPEYKRANTAKGLLSTWLGKNWGDV